MLKNIEDYIDKVMEIADLTSKDKKRVRTELEYHIQEILSAATDLNLNESEVI